MTIVDFVNKNRDLSAYRSEVSDLYAESVTQALRHTTRSEMSELHEVARPNEDPIFTKWRTDNKRNVTVDFTNSFNRMLQRIVSQTIKIEYDFEDLDKIIINKLISLSIQDPNAKIVEWPFMGVNPLSAPSSQEFQENQALDSKMEVIHSDRILYDQNDIFIYFLDKIVIEKTSYKRFIGIDKQSFYILTPYLDEKRVLNYRPDLWYFHNFGFLPIASLPGIEISQQIKDIIDKEKSKWITYKESICWPAFEWFDEGVVRFSSEQVVSIKHANAKLVINADIACPTCNGSGFHGSKKINSKDVPQTCKTCNGSRTLSNLSDFSNIKLKQGTQPGDQSNKEPIYYLEPPAGIKELQDAFLLFFDLGKKALCNDILEGTPNESGIAKEMRLEPKQDLMRSYGQQICYLIEDMVNNRNAIRGIKEVVKVSPPIYYETKSPELLKVQVTDSLQGERYMKYMDYVNAKFKGDDDQIKLHKFAVLYAPLALYKADEFDGAFNAGVYDERDAIRRDYAFYAVGEVLKKEPKLENMKEIREKADAFLIEMGFLPEQSDAEFDTDQKNKLLDTVEGS